MVQKCPLFVNIHTVGNVNGQTNQKSCQCSYEFEMHVTHELLLYDLWESARLISTLTKILGVICHITGSWLRTQMALHCIPFNGVLWCLTSDFSNFPFTNLWLLESYWQIASLRFVTNSWISAGSGWIPPCNCRRQMILQTALAHYTGLLWFKFLHFDIVIWQKIKFLLDPDGFELTTLPHYTSLP